MARIVGPFRARVRPDKLRALSGGSSLPSVAYLYGTSAGQIFWFIAPENSNDIVDGKPTTVDNVGGAGAAYAVASTGADLKVTEDVFTSIHDGTSQVGVMNFPAMETVGSRLFYYLNIAPTQDIAIIAGRASGTADGARTNVILDFAQQRVLLQRRSAYGMDDVYIPLTSLPRGPMLFEMEISGGNAYIFINGVLSGTAAFAYPTFMLQRLLGGYPSYQFMAGEMGVVMGMAVSGVPGAHDLEINAMRRYYNTRYGTAAVLIDVEYRADLWIGDYDQNSVTVTAARVEGGSSLTFAAIPFPSGETVYSSPVVVDAAYKFAKTTITGLLPGTEYDIRALIGGSFAGEAGRLRTPPSARAPIKIGFASCGERTRNHPIYSTIVDEDLDVFYHTGDRGYFDITGQGVDHYPTFNLYDDQIFAQPLQAAFHRSLPVVHIWDDHDFGSNNSQGASSAKPYALQWARNRAPIRPAMSGVTDPIHRLHFPVPGVVVALLDGRSQRVAGDFLGAAQEAWLISVIQNLPNDALLIISCGVPWISANDTDTWHGAADQRARIAAAVLANCPGRAVIIAGDAHMLAFDDGRNSEGNMPVFQSAPLGRANSSKGGPYSGGIVRVTQQQYATMDLTPIEGGWHIAFRGYSVDDLGLKTEHLFFEADMIEPIVTPIYTFADDFNRPDGDPGIEWVAVESLIPPIESGAIRSLNGSHSMGLANFDQGFSDQFAQITALTHGNGNAQIQPCVRLDPANTNGTWYGLVMSGGAAVWEIRKRVGGTSTTLISFSVGTKTYPMTGRLEARGTTLVAFKDGVEVARVDDPDLSSGVPGLRTYKASGDATAIYSDNFLAGQLAPTETVQFSVTAVERVDPATPVGGIIASFVTNGTAVTIGGTDAAILAVSGTDIVTTAEIGERTNVSFSLTASAPGMFDNVFAQSILVEAPIEPEDPGDPLVRPVIVQTAAGPSLATGPSLNPSTAIFSAPPTAGNTITLFVITDKAESVWDVPAGFNLVAQHTGGTGISGAIYTKVSDGTETEIVAGGTTGDNMHELYAVETTPATVDVTAVGSAQASSNSRGTATTITPTAESLLLAIWANDSNSTTAAATDLTIASGWSIVDASGVTAAYPRKSAATSSPGYVIMSAEGVAGATPVSLSYLGGSSDENLILAVALEV